MIKTAELARGKWRGILLALGVERKYLEKKHGPCPWCGGNDRYRYDDADGKGTFICGQCGSGDGFELLMRFKGYGFQEAAKEVEKIVGGVKAEPPKQKMTEETRRGMLRRLWEGSKPLGNDMAASYLKGRGTPLTCPSLRFHPQCPVPGSRDFLPAMLALVTDADGKPANIHRTFVGPNGKADLPNPRAMMPGEIPEGSAVRLFQVEGDTLGIAEGIETAIAAADRFKVPVWSAINSTMLSKWSPPKGVAKVAIFCDNDKMYGGQASAYSLAHRLSVRSGLEIHVRIPPDVGRDWADYT